MNQDELFEGPLHDLGRIGKSFLSRSTNGLLNTHRAKGRNDTNILTTHLANAYNRWLGQQKLQPTITTMRRWAGKYGEAVLNELNKGIEDLTGIPAEGIETITKNVPPMKPDEKTGTTMNSWSGKDGRIQPKLNRPVKQEPEQSQEQSSEEPSNNNGNNVELKQTVLNDLAAIQQRVSKFDPKNPNSQNMRNTIVNDLKKVIKLAQSADSMTQGAVINKIKLLKDGPRALIFGNMLNSIPDNPFDGNFDNGSEVDHEKYPNYQAAVDNVAKYNRKYANESIIYERKTITVDTKLNILQIDNMMRPVARYLLDAGKMAVDNKGRIVSKNDQHHNYDHDEEEQNNHEVEPKRSKKRNFPLEKFKSELYKNKLYNKLNSDDRLTLERLLHRFHNEDELVKYFTDKNNDLPLMVRKVIFDTLLKKLTAR